MNACESCGSLKLNVGPLCSYCIESFVERLMLQKNTWEFAGDPTPRVEHMSVHKDHYLMYVHLPLPATTDIPALEAEIMEDGS